MPETKCPAAYDHATGLDILAVTPASTAPLPRRQAGEPLRIFITGVVDAGRGGGPELWRAELETGDVLLARTRQPLLDGARALLALGVDPATPVTMRRPGSDIDVFRPIRVGVAAKFSVSEPAERSVHFRRWRPGPEMAGACGGGGGKPALGAEAGIYPARSADAGVAGGAL